MLPLLFDLIDEGWLYKEQKITRQAWQEHMKLHREKASKHKGIFVYYEEIRDQLLANPDFSIKSYEKDGALDSRSNRARPRIPSGLSISD